MEKCDIDFRLDDIGSASIRLWAFHTPLPGSSFSELLEKYDDLALHGPALDSHLCGKHQLPEAFLVS